MADGSSNLEIIISAVDEASAALEEVNTSLEGVAETVAESTAAVDADFAEMQASIAETGTAVGLSYSQMAEMLDQDNAEIQQTMIDTGATAEEAAAIIEEANAAIAASGEDTAAEVGTSSALTKGNFMAVGVAAGLAFAGISSAVSGAIDSAKSWDEESAVIAQTLKDTGSSIPIDEVQAYAQHIQSVTILTQQEALQSEGLILSNKNLQGSYQSLTLLAADLATKMSQTSGTLSDNLPNATKLLTNALADPVAGINQLIRQGTIQFPAATVTMIENMAKVGNTAGADAAIIQALNAQVGGMAEAAAAAPGAGLTQLSNSLTALGTQVGVDLLPDLDALAKALLPIITDVTNWVAEHPKLTEAIIASTVAFFGLLAVLTLVGIIIAALASPFAAMALMIAGIGAIVVALAVLIATNWDTIKSVTESVWGDITTFFSKTWDWVKNLFTTSLDDVKATWQTAWTDMSNVLQTIWQTIENIVKTGVNAVIGAINAFINALDAIHISIPSIGIPGTKLATPAINLGFSIPDIPMLAEGGFVTQPTLALIGESGPEAVVPLSGAGAGYGGQQIVVNITGGNYLDSQGAQMIAQQLAKQVLRGMKVVNYAL